MAQTICLRSGLLLSNFFHQLCLILWHCFNSDALVCVRPMCNNLVIENGALHNRLLGLLCPHQRAVGP